MTGSGRDDGWKKRRIEQILAGELQEAGEAVRLESLRVQGLAASSAGAQLSDSLLAVQRARDEFARVQQVWSRATERWVAFVQHGTVPEDIESQEL